MTISNTSEVERYEELITRIVADYPDRIRLRHNGRIGGRRTTQIASRALAARIAKSGYGSASAQGRTLRPRRLVEGLQAIPLETAAELGLQSVRLPDRLRCEPVAARLGFDLVAADAVGELMRRAKMENTAGRRYLFVGCGCGLAIRALLLAYPTIQWVGVDADSEAVAWARANIKGASFQQMPNAPPISKLADGSFDGVVALNVAVSREPADIRRWLGEYWRVVKPNGFLITAAPGVAALAHFADHRAYPVAKLAASYWDLRDRGFSTLSLTDDRTTLFAEDWFRGNVLDEYWEPQDAAFGVGPDLVDMFFANRRTNRRSGETRAEDKVDGLARGSIGSNLFPAKPCLKRFVLLAMQRTGSNMVVSALNTHPAIHCHGELFRRSAARASAGMHVLNCVNSQYWDDQYRHNNSEDFLEDVFSLSYDAEFVGFKLLLPQNPLIKDSLIADSRYKKVLLSRDNVLARYSSNEIAKTNRNKQITDDTRNVSQKIVFEEKQFIKFMNNHYQLYNNAREELRKSCQSFLDISYLDACESRGLGAIVEAIGASPMNGLTAQTRKRNPSDILSRFANSAVVESFLEKNELQHWKTE